MKVFISWSGEKSKDFANALRDWLPYVIQDLLPWVSDRDIDSGAMSMAEIHQQLAEVTYGIICTTSENQARPWINYEAGALWKSLDNQSRVVPLLIDIEREDITSPLGNFQSRLLTRASNRKDEFWRLIRSLNEARHLPIAEAIIQDAFERQWHRMDYAITHIEKNSYAYTSVMRPTDKKLEDIHQTLLKLEQAQRRSAQTTLDSLDEILERKGNIGFGTLSQEMSGRQTFFERTINESLIARQIHDEAHVQRVDKHLYNVYTVNRLPEEIKRSLSAATKKFPEKIDFEYLLTMTDDPGPDDL
ncbi:toll/interleukin-1 receptor domain-containing protein [Arthrobacter cavernae]|uniref:Toll/interleukin-1 receptor domain-containing protein n=1 Tax=Arthrobacter cavernae TaxID=2817681 RepID=A0A939KLE0_9MICC|nr:toll/interleukin-1 receptor domain-containing protein [Arthrobacter cavernae]MBO1267061.1 toll/interleukin-1 receptor domain-containing protein [Arthrobacter cavernae]